MKRGSSQTIYTYKPYWLSWMIVFEALFGCHDVLILVKSPIKWWQRRDMTIAVDWDAKPQLKPQLKEIQILVKLVSA